MSAPKGQDVPILEDEAIERVLDIPVDPDDESSETLGESDRSLRSLVYTGGSTEYAHIYLAITSGVYNGNDMLWIRYVWLSKPGAFESDMFGSNGMSLRMVDGMADAVTSAVAAACERMKAGYDADADPVYTEAE